MIYKRYKKRGRFFSIQSQKITVAKHKTSYTVNNWMQLDITEYNWI